MRILREGGHGTILSSNALFTLQKRKVTIYNIEKLDLLQKDSWENLCTFNMIYTRAGGMEMADLALSWQICWQRSA